MTETKAEDNGARYDRNSVSLEELLKIVMLQQGSVQQLTDRLGKVVEEMRETRGEGAVQQAELVAEIFATQLRQNGANTLTRDASDEIRSYSELRARLGGQNDVGAMTKARIRAIDPPHARVGDSIFILLEDAGNPTTVAFATQDGGVVDTNTFNKKRAIDGMGRKLPVQVIEVAVPAGAVTGRVTVVTDHGEPTSPEDFRVDDLRGRRP